MEHFDSRTYLANLRNFKLYCLYRRRIDAQECQFCSPDPDTNPLLPGSNTYWMVWNNVRPYDHTAHHLVITPRRHVTAPQDLTKEERLSLWDVVDWAQNALDIGGAALAFRWGDPTVTGASVDHLHAHILVPNGVGQAGFDLGRSKEALEKQQMLLADWERRYENGDRE